jgi:hypothetical protein
MTPMQVIPTLDPLEDRDPGFGLRLELTPVEQLPLEGREEAFGHGVVVGITDRAIDGMTPICWQRLPNATSMDTRLKR